MSETPATEFTGQPIHDLQAHWKNLSQKLQKRSMKGRRVITTADIRMCTCKHTYPQAHAHTYNIVNTHTHTKAVMCMPFSQLTSLPLHLGGLSFFFF